MQQFDLVEEIGRGGFAIVYKARDLHLDQMVAIKELHVSDSSLLRNEAKRLSELRLHNIVGFRQLSSDDGQWYMVMDYIDGCCLAELITKAPTRLPVDAASGIARQICAGLHYAHTHFRDPLIHRDIKPADILIATDGTAKIADFGIAKALEGTRASGTVTGTYSYMAPETFDGLLSPQSDIWAVGITLFEMLTGRPPYEFTGNLRPFLAALEKPIQFPSGFPDRLKTVVKKACAINMADRYHDAGFMQTWAPSGVEAARTRLRTCHTWVRERSDIWV